jgi:hypothetical protein
VNPVVQASSTVDPSQVRALLERLRSALADGDLSGSAEILSELLSLRLPDDCREPAGRLKELIDVYEYDEAAEIVNQLLARLPGGENA